MTQRATPAVAAAAADMSHTEPSNVYETRPQQTSTLDTSPLHARDHNHSYQLLHQTTVYQQQL